MTDSRLSKQTVNTRKSRAAQNRTVTEDRTQTDAERLAIFNAAQDEAMLPNIPPIPGYHVVWLTSSNTRDTLAMRHRQGYVPVTEEDVNGFQLSTDKGGVQDGLIRVNEMVAYKLPMSLYNMYMQQNHHYRPAAEETKLTDTATGLRQKAKSQGSDVDEGDGVEALRKLEAIQVPDFSEE